MLRNFSALLILAISVPVGAAKNAGGRRLSVAVIPFHNNTGNKGLNFLSTALAEGAGTSISKDKNLRLVERMQLGAVLKEIELQQSGLMDDSAIKLPTGKIPADVLLVGSYSGRSADLTVTIKAIDVHTAQVLAMRRAEGSVDNIISKIEALMPEIAALMSGGSIAELTVISVPDGATVYLDGNQVGVTPLISFKTTEGRHELRVIKSKFRDTEQQVDLVAEEKRKIDIHLLETGSLNRPHVDAGAFWFKPFQGFSTSGMFGTFGLGYSFRRFLIRFEFAAPALISYKYTYKVPYGTLEDSRDYAFYMFHIGVNYHFYESGMFAPYVGLQAGYTRILENGINTTLYSYDNTRRLIHAPTAIGILGVDLFPASAFVLFLEARYYQSIVALDRSEVNNISFLGTADIQNRPFYLSAFAIGGGLRVRF